MTVVKSDEVSRRGMNTPWSGPSGPSHSTATRCARVLRRQAENLGESDRAKVAEADEADPGHTDPIHEVRSEPCRDHPLERVRVDSIVDQKAPFDRGCRIRNVFHGLACAFDDLSRLWRKTTCSGHTADRKLPTETARRSGTSE